MPVVLVEVGGVARSGHIYADLTGSEYEYPAGRYEKWIRTGERFVYQSPGRGYTGVGLIGTIRNSSRRGRLICEILSPVYFDSPVPLKHPDGYYLEADTSHWKGNVYWGQGVRPLTDSRYQEILNLALNVTLLAERRETSAYPNDQTTLQVEEYSVRVATRLMAARFGARVIAMPHNNPGFDLRVESGADTVRFVEVKGTRSATPVFWMSEGERRFAAINANQYTLVVVCGIDIQRRTHGRTYQWDGELAHAGVVLEVSQWRGELRIPGRDSGAV